MPARARTVVSYFHGIDPAAALVADGEILAYAEEERLIRHKHAPHVFPLRSIKACLDMAGRGLEDVDCFVYGWDAPRYGGGDMSRFYAAVNDGTLPTKERVAGRRAACDSSLPRRFDPCSKRSSCAASGYDPEEVPELVFYPHHRTHAAAAFYLSPFDEALVLTLDGSGDGECTALWRGSGATLEPIHEIGIPNSLGWFYAALTEISASRPTMASTR